MTTSQLNSGDMALLERQSAEVTAFLDRHIPADRRVAILQFPMDGNVGNHMMWLAITDYLRAKGRAPSYASYDWDFDIGHMMRAIGEDGTVLFLGGVTVSRLWPGHAKVKRDVAAACPGNRLVSLPSTMMFVDDEDRREASTIFGDHAHVTMMARDPVSAASAREVFPDHIAIETIHDSTFVLPPQKRGTAAPTHDIIWLARDDQEGAGFKAPDNVLVFDWPELDHRALRVKYARAGMKLRRQVPAACRVANSLVANAYRSISENIVANGNRLLDTGKVLVTDRMHPHVLTALRGQPCVLLPDKFGKNRAVWDYSSHGYSSVYWADTPAEALSKAQALAKEMA